MQFSSHLVFSTQTGDPLNQFPWFFGKLDRDAATKKVRAMRQVRIVGKKKQNYISGVNV